MEFAPGEIVMVQGRRAGSHNEAYVAAALDKWKIRYDYQVPLVGGTSERGGIVLDFLCYMPWQQPVEVQAGIWHKGARGQYDFLKLAIEENIFKVKVVEFFEHESNSYEAAVRAVKEKLGVAG